MQLSWAALEMDTLEIDTNTCTPAERHVLERIPDLTKLGPVEEWAFDEGSAYAIAAGLTEKETAEAIRNSLVRTRALASIHGGRDTPMSVGFVQACHRSIFSPAFGEQTLDFRRNRADIVEYPYYLETHGTVVVKTTTGNAPKQVVRQLRDASRAFERAVTALEKNPNPELADAVRPCLAMYAKIIRIHPYMDGNGRTARAVFSYTLGRVGLPDIHVKITDQTRLALGHAIRPKKTPNLEPLVAIVVDVLKRSNED